MNEEPQIIPEREAKMRNFVLICLGITLLLVLLMPALV